ncbi:predicted protein [Histoplasma mississippiense (nom. inval.)]|uniref:predicted protein n=1 Tax=Ajellomyces capsulatus (strain NAm1 / WU24) TaxID=2059318 RepID=UPI000157CD8E|nr:predicted protein [Histoplasma mississippiense (nom. inval.)]EDN10165.1 predicted protein [Histoplasma mississippiense (nom. inval.)]
MATSWLRMSTTDSSTRRRVFKIYPDNLDWHRDVIYKITGTQFVTTVSNLIQCTVQWPSIKMRLLYPYSM